MLINQSLTTSRFSPYSSISSQNHQVILTASGHLLALQCHMDPANGTVSYTNARITAKLLKLSDEFIIEYGHMFGERIDFGEYNVWARSEMIKRHRYNADHGSVIMHITQSL